MLNSKRLDLSDADVTEDVSPCYTDTEAGAYFAGNGYAVISKKNITWN